MIEVDQTTMKSKILLLILATVAIGSTSLLIYKSVDWGHRTENTTIFSHVNQSEDAEIVQRSSTATPTFARPPLGNIDEWLDWQRALRVRMKDDVFELSARIFTPRQPQVVVNDRQEIDGGLTRLELWIPAGDGHRIPAILLLPDVTGPMPGILVVPGHVKDGESGLQQMTYAIPSYHNSAALELAKAGFATLTIELRGFGVIGPPNFPNHRSVAFNAIQAGSFYKKLAVQDIQYAFEYLLSHKDIDSSRIGMTGVSLGGELAVAYAGLDDRVTAIAFNAYGGKVGSFPRISSSKAKVPHYCHVIPGSNQLYLREDPFLLLAPRPTLAIRGVEQPFSQPAFFDILNETWEALGYAKNIEIANLEGQSKHDGHAYFVAESVRFFSDKL